MASSRHALKHRAGWIEAVLQQRTGASLPLPEPRANRHPAARPGDGCQDGHPVYEVESHSPSSSRRPVAWGVS